MKKQEIKNPGRTRRVRFPVYESITQTASALGVPAALVKQCKRAGSPAFLPGNRIDTGVLIPQLFTVLLARSKIVSLDLAQEQAALAKERRIEKARENRIAEGQVHVLADVEKVVWEKALLPTREAMLQMSRICAAQCNPADPALAQRVLDAYVARLLKNIRDSIPPEMEDDKAE